MTASPVFLGTIQDPEYDSDNCIVLDPAASDHLFKSADLLTNIRNTDIVFEYHGIGGSMEVTQCGDFGTIGPVNFNAEAPANILSFSAMRRKSIRLEYDYNEDTFYVHCKRGTMTFPCNSHGLYVCYIPKNVIKGKAFISTVYENEMKYTKREVEAAKKASELKKKLGYASDADLALALSRGDIVNSDLTAKDVKRMTDIYGRSLGELKGKTKKSKPNVTDVSYTDIYIREEQVIEGDVMFVEGMPFLLTVSTPLGLLTVTRLNSRTFKEMWAALQQQLSIYSSEGFRVHNFYFDRESALKLCAEMMRQSGYQPQQSGAGGHVPRVENKVKTVKERIRAILNTLPYELPRNILQWLVYYVIVRLNSLPCHTRMDPTPPRQILLGRKIDALKDLALEFGAYVQVHAVDVMTTTNTMQSRTEGALSLMPEGNTMGTWLFWGLKTRRVVARDHWTELPLSQEIIDYISAIARKSRARVGRNPVLKVGNRVVEDSNIGVAVGEQPNLVEIAGMEPPARVAPEQHIQPVLPVEEVGNDEADEDPEVAVVDARDAPPIFEQEIIVNEDADGNDAGTVVYEPAETEIVDLDSANIPRSDTPYIAENEPVIDSTEEDGVDEEGSSPAELQLPAPTPQEVQHELQQSSQPLRRSTRSTRGRNSRYAYFTLEQSTGTLRLNKAYDARLLNAKARCQLVYNITVQAALKKFGSVADEAIIKELRQLHSKSVFEGADFRKLPHKVRKSIIRSSMFLKEKFDAHGVFTKLKARLVAGGHMQDRSIYEDVSSPTATLQSVLTISVIAAKQSRFVVTADIGGAYLNANMEKDVYMRLEKKIAEIMVQDMPEYKQFLCADGSILVKLKKALYGCVESGKLWNDMLTAQLKSMGYQPNSYEPCVFNKTVNGVQCTVVVYVDDLMFTCINMDMIQKDLDILKDKYNDISIHIGDVHSYLGMVFDYGVRNKVRVTMSGYVDDMLREVGVRGTATSPATELLFVVDEESPMLDPERLAEFHSRVAKVLYLAKRVRPDCLCAISYLSTRVQCANEDDESKLTRLFKYINGTREMGIILEASTNNIMQAMAYIDASFATHHDKKSHTGVYITLGHGPIFVRSTKQRLVTKSSTEAELVGLSDSFAMAIWFANFLEAQGFERAPAKIFQDNKSTIIMAKKGMSTSERTRHISIRYFFIHDKINNNEVEVEYMASEYMIADILTKPLQGDLFRRLRQKLMNWDS